MTKKVYSWYHLHCCTSVELVHITCTVHAVGWDGSDLDDTQQVETPHNILSNGAELQTGLNYLIFWIRWAYPIQKQELTCSLKRRALMF